MQKRTMKRIPILGLALVCSALVLGCFDDDDDDETVGGNGDGDGDATYTQVDRMGIPTLNTVFNHPPSAPGFSKVAYNRKGPQSDTADYTAQFVTVLGAVANANPAQTAALLLPDELPVDLAADTSDFAALNGRRLADDAVDVALSVTIGDTLSHLRSDNVDANDKPFLDAFPFLAPPH